MKSLSLSFTGTHKWQTVALEGARNAPSRRLLRGPRVQTEESASGNMSVFDSNSHHGRPLLSGIRKNAGNKTLKNTRRARLLEMPCVTESSSKGRAKFAATQNHKPITTITENHWMFSGFASSTIGKSDTGKSSEA